MAPQNPSVVLYGKGDIRIEDRPIPVPKPNQLLVKVHTVGICGSDVHYYTHGSIGRFVVREPMVLGHETSGIVVGMGSDVKGFAVGLFFDSLFKLVFISFFLAKLCFLATIIAF